MHTCPSRRREFLAGVVGIGVAGCIDHGSAEPISESRSLTDWTHEHARPDRRGFLGEATVPEEPKQTESLDLPGANPPAVTDGILFVPEVGTGITAIDLSTEGVAPTWETDVESTLVTGVVVHDGVVVCGSRDGTVTALDAYTGTVRWTFLPESMEREPERRLRPVTPGIDDGTVVVPYGGVADKRLFGLDLESGEREWTANTPGDPAAPVVVDDVVVTGDAAVTPDGTTRWENPLVSEISPPSPNGVAVAGDRVVSVWQGGEVVQSVDLDSGTEQWRVETAGATRNVPATQAGAVFTGGTAVETDDGESRWSAFGASFSSPVVTERRVATGDADGTLYGLDIDTGETLWTVTMPSDVADGPARSIRGGPILGADTLVAPTEAGIVLVS